MLFGIHLVRQGLVSSDTFVSAVEAVLASRVPIGRLAVEARYISMKQVFEILGRQSTTGERFGEIAVRLGYLTEVQLAELLARQAHRDRSVGEVLVQSGAVSPTQLEDALARFRHRQVDPFDALGTPGDIPSAGRRVLRDAAPRQLAAKPAAPIATTL